jgi:hypothetical protein
MIPSVRKRWASLALPALILAGCGGGNAPSGADQTTAAVSTSPAAPSFYPSIEASQKAAASSGLAAATDGLTKAIVTSCQEQVKLQLKAPLTARFDPVKAVPDPEAAGWYTVSGHLQSSNLMGVPLGATYDCKYSLDAQRQGTVNVQDVVPD